MGARPLTLTGSRVQRLRNTSRPFHDASVPDHGLFGPMAPGGPLPAVVVPPQCGNLAGPAPGHGASAAAIRPLRPIIRLAGTGQSLGIQLPIKQDVPSRDGTQQDHARHGPPGSTMPDIHRDGWPPQPGNGPKAYSVRIFDCVATTCYSSAAFLDANEPHLLPSNTCPHIARQPRTD